jgi:hypothetical protein
MEVTLSGTERLTTSYYFAGAQRIAMREGVTLTYLHGDHLGSASLATDAAGAQVSVMRYTPFGETLRLLPMFPLQMEFVIITTDDDAHISKSGALWMTRPSVI